jgi:hypothetical protein
VTAKALEKTHWVLFLLHFSSHWVLSYMLTIVETDWFIKRVSKLLSPDEKDDLISYVAANPEAGSVIAKTGGVRKLRYAREG